MCARFISVPPHRDHLKRRIGNLKEKSLVSRVATGMKGKWWIILIAALGVLLLTFGGGMKAETQEVGFSIQEAELYRERLTAAVKTLCEQVDGVGNATVFLTLAETECARYEKNQTASGESVALESGNALLLGYSMPKIAGVAVVCDGGESVGVQKELSCLLSASLGISTTRIYISSSGRF